MLSELSSKWSGEFANSPALIHENRTLTYGGLCHAMRDLSQSLSERGLGAADTVAVQFPNSIECAVTILAAANLDARILLLDPTLKPGAVAQYCARAGARTLLSRASSETEAGESFRCTGSFGEISIRVSSVDSASSETPGSRSSTEGAAFLLLSSGTSGPPKLVVRTGAQTEAALKSFHVTLPYEPHDRVLALLPFFHSFGLLNVLLSTLASGATLFVASFSPRNTIAAIASHRITVLPATPFIFRLLADTHFSEPPDVSSLRIAVSAGAALSRELGAKFHETFGVGIHQSYGSTESGPISLARYGERIDEQGWVGRPYADVTVEVLDDAGKPLPPGVTGDIVVRSAGNASAYLGNEEASAATFKDGRVFTGDVGCLNADGHVFISGRKKRMLNVAGNKVSPAEVEGCLTSHPRVADAYVTAVAAGSSDASERIKAFVVPAGEVTALELQEFCGQRLAGFKVPRQITFVSSLDRRAMGKLRSKTNPEKET